MFKLTTAALARICHEANRAYCETLGDYSQKPWEKTDQATRESAIAGVSFRLENPLCTPETMHQNWMDLKLADGWTYGDTKNAAAKTHPCICEYELLPVEQKAKDELFSGIVDALRQLS